MINVHHFFSNALSKSQELVDAINGNIFIYPCDEELSKNPSKPYIIVANRGSENIHSDKDERMDGSIDTSTVELLVVGDTDASICQIAHLARTVIADAMNSFDAEQFNTLGWWLTDSDYSDKGIQFSQESGNMYALLSYSVETEIN